MQLSPKLNQGIPNFSGADRQKVIGWTTGRLELSAEAFLDAVVGRNWSTWGLGKRHFARDNNPKNR